MEKKNKKRIKKGDKMKRVKLFSLLVIGMVLFLSGNVNSQSANNNYIVVAQVMPQPVGGIESVYNQIPYKRAEKNSDLCKKIYLITYIDETGHVDEVKIIKGINPEVDGRIIEAIKATQFTPAKNNGSIVKSKLAISLMLSV